MKVRTSIDLGSGRTVPEHRGPRFQGGRAEGNYKIASGSGIEQYLKEKGLKVRTSCASGSCRPVPEHKGPQPQGGQFEGKNNHSFREW